jgi:hypothetical protein
MMPRKFLKEVVLLYDDPAIAPPLSSSFSTSSVRFITRRYSRWHPESAEICAFDRSFLILPSFLLTSVGAAYDVGSFGPIQLT